LCLALILLFVMTAGVYGQETRELIVLGTLEGTTLAAASSSDLDAATAAKLTGAGLLGGAVGLVGGAYLGALLAHNDDCAECLDELGGALVLGTAGEAFLLPLGVHLANGSRGSYWTAALVSAGIGTAGVVIMRAAHWDPPTVPIVLVAVPLAQLTTSIAIERATDESNP
jgi:hypothetical protein